MEKHSNQNHFEHGDHSQRDHGGHYQRLVVMIGLSFIAMYILMYAMVDAFREVYSNINQVYMAGLMTAPMVLIELLLMRKMYPNQRLNVLIGLGALVAGILFFAGIRKQTAISDTQFVRSMIPHHSGAILMCRESAIRDPELKELCRRINESQSQEIAQMEAILQRLNQR